MKNVWIKFCNFWRGVWNYIKDLAKHPKDVIIPVLLAEALFWSPVWVCAVFAILFSPWWWTVVSAVIIFWCGPFTPAVPLQVGLIALFIKLFNKRRNKNGRK